VQRSVSAGLPRSHLARPASSAPLPPALQVIQEDFDGSGPYGDRRQEIVFIGVCDCTSCCPLPAVGF
jgi:hypothetical protein